MIGNLVWWQFCIVAVVVGVGIIGFILAMAHLITKADR